MHLFLKVFLLAFVFECGVIYNLYGVDILSQNSVVKDLKHINSDTISDCSNHHSNNFSPIEVLETECQEEIDDKKNDTSDNNSLLRKVKLGINYANNYSKPLIQSVKNGFIKIHRFILYCSLRFYISL